ncbi:MAG: SDR family oxidoreductase [Bdellovibrionales bacterium]|nr:SDR family oxidoreductase [Bdellovibrionales bacterium]
MKDRRIAITGANGYVGTQIVQALAREAQFILALDIRQPAEEKRQPGVTYLISDIRDPGLANLLKENRIDTVVHLASIVTPGKESRREFEYSVDVDGTRNALDACVHAGVQQIIISSSGAAYGYHADQPDWLKESDPVRGNYEFAYSWHKRLVEEMLTEYRKSHPQLKQCVFRIGTVLGKTVNNQITALFEKRVMVAIQGSKSPFVFIWDQDLVDIFLMAIQEKKAGIFNVAGDGALTIFEIAKRLNKPVISIPPFVLKAALFVLKLFGLTRYGPEQIDFLRYRPVLLNHALKDQFGYTPKKTSADVFEYWKQSKVPATLGASASK